MAPIKLVIKLNGRPIFQRKLEIEDNNGLEEEKSSKKVRLLDSGNKVYVIKLNGRPICKRKLEIEDHYGLQEEKSPKKDYLNGKSGLITCMKTVGRHSLYNHRGRILSNGLLCFWVLESFCHVRL
ncbi:hypothetical protein MKX03_034679 [Papaver bracteatum]|nr:hypothetical protein MKX03_034679 [Papaver bracteatum]